MHYYDGREERDKESFYRQAANSNSSFLLGLELGGYNFLVFGLQHTIRQPFLRDSLSFTAGSNFYSLIFIDLAFAN